MGQSADQLRQEIDQRREDTTAKIDAIEQRIEATVQQTKESLDIRRQIEEKPLLSIGVALVGGFVLGGIISGDRDRERSYGTHQGGIRHAAKSAGLEDTIANATAVLMETLNERLKVTLDQSFPGFADRMRQTQGTGGGFAEQRSAAREPGIGGGPAAISRLPAEAGRLTDAAAAGAGEPSARHD